MVHRYDHLWLEVAGSEKNYQENKTQSNHLKYCLDGNQRSPHMPMTGHPPTTFTAKATWPRLPGSHISGKAGLGLRRGHV